MPSGARDEQIYLQRRQYQNAHIIRGCDGARTLTSSPAIGSKHDMLSLHVARGERRRLRAIKRETSGKTETDKTEGVEEEEEMNHEKERWRERLTKQEEPVMKQRWAAY